MGGILVGGTRGSSPPPDKNVGRIFDR